MADDHIDQPPFPESPKKKRKKRKPLNCAGTSLGSCSWVSRADLSSECRRLKLKCDREGEYITTQIGYA